MRVRVRLRAAAVACVGCFACSAIAPGTVAAAPINAVLGGSTLNGAAIPCTTLDDGVRACHGTIGGGAGGSGPDLRVRSFDGQPLEVYVLLPPVPTSGPDGNYPLLAQSHGWASHAGGPSDGEYQLPVLPGALARAGYAVLQLSARGFGDSCGSTASRQANPTACLKGYVRLNDERYEAHDVQDVIGLLVDEGIADPQRLGAEGESYGASVSLELATLNDRVMHPDGSLVRWRSPEGTSLRFAGVSAVGPWSDITTLLLGNGHGLDYEIGPPTTDIEPIGVAKPTLLGVVSAFGLGYGFLSPPLTDREEDVTTWVGAFGAGEPYEPDPVVRYALATLAKYHSAYSLLYGADGWKREAPAPVQLFSGLTDDLWPADESVRYFNLEHSLYPDDPLELIAGDGGHPRGQNKPADVALAQQAVMRWLDHYVKQVGVAPLNGAAVSTQTCPFTAPSGGPFIAPTFEALHPGEVRYTSATPQTIVSSAGDPTIGARIDPITSTEVPVLSGACQTVPAADQTGVASYRMPAATGSGYTLLGSPTVTAHLQVTGAFSYVAARLWDVDPSTGNETLLARTVYRIDPNHPEGTQTFQLHPGAWHFAAGHIPKLELLGQDPPYARVSNGQFAIAVSDLQLRLPVHEQPGSAPGVVSPSTPRLFGPAA